MPTIFARARLSALALCMWGCAGSAARTQVVAHVQSGRYTEAVARYEQDGKARAVLEALAQSLLTSAAQSAQAEQRRAAFVELGLLGTRAQDLLMSLSRPEQPAAVRAAALRLRLALGEQSARPALRALRSDGDPTVADQAFAALDADADWPLLSEALTAARKQRRAAALASLAKLDGRSQLRDQQRDALAQVARLDPEPQLRASALGALPRFGAAALPAIEAALVDPEPEVRSAARRGVWQLEPARGRVLLDQQLGAAVSSESIDAALLLLTAPELVEPERAQALLTAALASPDPTLRAQAAGSLALVPEARRDRAFLHARLVVEPSRAVRLSLALALGTADPVARKALVSLSEAADLTGAEAAAELAARDVTARARLRALTGHGTVIVRATAARLIARQLHESDPLVKLLGDPAWQVRSAAAGAVLSVL